MYWKECIIDLAGFKKIFPPHAVFHPQSLRQLLCIQWDEVRAEILESFAIYWICSCDKPVNFTEPSFSLLENDYSNCFGLLWVLGEEDT